MAFEGFSFGGHNQGFGNQGAGLGAIMRNDQGGYDVPEGYYTDFTPQRWDQITASMQPGGAPLPPATGGPGPGGPLAPPPTQRPPQPTGNEWTATLPGQAPAGPTAPQVPMVSPPMAQQAPMAPQASGPQMMQSGNPQALRSTTQRGGPEATPEAHGQGSSEQSGGGWLDTGLGFIESVFDKYGDDAAGFMGAWQAMQGTDDQVTRPYFYPGQEEGLTAAADLARQATEQGPDQYYGGQTVADLDRNLIGGQNNWLSRTDQLNQMARKGGQAAANLSQGGAGRVGGFGLQDQIGFGLPEQYQNAIMNPIMDNLNEQVIPGIHTAATGQGAFGGSRMQQQKSDAATQATKAATDAMIRGNLDARQQSIGQRAGDISAQLQGRGQDITQNQIQNQAMQQGMGGMSDAMRNMLMSGQIQQEVGRDRTQHNQALINADKDRFDWNRNERQNYIDRLFGRMQGMKPGGAVVEGRDGDWMDALAGFSRGSSIWNAMGGGK